MNLTFIALPGFYSEWTRFRLKDEDLQRLEAEFMKNPLAGAVMSGTGGLRKMRFSPSSRGGGKSGAFRVAYVYFQIESAVYLMAIFAKKDQANLTAGQKKQLKKVVESLAKSSNR